MFRFNKTDIKDLVVIEPFLFMDERGTIKKSFEKNVFKENGIDLTAAEELETTSGKGVVRGLHLQTRHSQAKLIRVARGEMYDVAVDLRKDSETFGKWFGIRLSEKNRKMLYIPEGFAHGCMILEDHTTFYYLCSQSYYPGYDSGILWNDRTLNITWPIGEVKDIILSEKDRGLMTFQKFVTDFSTESGV